MALRTIRFRSVWFRPKGRGEDEPTVNALLGETVDLTPAEEKRLDALGALEPKGKPKAEPEPEPEGDAPAPEPEAEPGGGA